MEGVDLILLLILQPLSSLASPDNFKGDNQRLSYHLVSILSPSSTPPFLGTLAQAQRERLVSSMSRDRIPITLCSRSREGISEA